MAEIIKNPLKRVANYLVDEKMTEADRRGIYLCLLAILGSMYGGKLKGRLGSLDFPIGLFIFLVGSTSKSRKSEAVKKALMIAKEIDLLWRDSAVRNGLRTGPGLLREILKIENDIHGFKKLCAVENEGVSVFRDSHQKDGTLLDVVRQAFDQDDLGKMVQGDPVSIRNYLLTLIACITPTELYEVLPKSSFSNGVLNRFLFQEVVKENTIPIPKKIDFGQIRSELEQVRLSVKKAELIECVELSNTAEECWLKIHNQLEKIASKMESDEQFLDIIARALPHIFSLATILALTELSQKIEVDHLDEAYRIWRGCAASAYNLFCRAIQDKNAANLLAALQKAGAEGLSSSDIYYNVFQKNKTELKIRYCTEYLEKRGLAKSAKIKKPGVAGRPATRWIYTDPLDFKV